MAFAPSRDTNESLLSALEVAVQSFHWLLAREVGQDLNEESA